MIENPEDLGPAQDTREPSFILCPQNGEEIPIVLKEDLVIELDAGVADAQSFRRPLGSVATKEKVVLKFALADLSRSFLVVID